MAKTDKENIYSLKGLSSVFKFTTGQIFKNKSYLIGLFIIVVLVALTGPIGFLSQKSNASIEESVGDFSQKQIESVNGVVVLNATDTDYTKEALVSALGDDLSKKYIEVTNNLEDLETLNYDFNNSVSLSEDLGENVEAKDTFLTVYISREVETGSYLIEGVVSDNSIISKTTEEDILDLIEDSFNELRYKEAGVSEKDIDLISAGIKTSDSVSETDYYKEAKDEYNLSEHFNEVFALDLVIFILISSSISFIVMIVMEEKTSKLAETILVSVRPLALIMGKILSITCYIASMVILGALALVVSDKICMQLFHNYQASSFLNMKFLIEKGPIAVILILLSFASTYLIFAIIAGIMGSSATKMEDIQSSSQVVAFINLVPYIVTAIGIAAIPNNVLVILSLIPPFSCYLAPICYLANITTMPIMIVSIIIQLVILVALFMLCAKVYRVLILRDNKKAKIKDIIKIAREKGEVN